MFVEEGWDYDGNGLDHETYDYNHVINFLNTKYPSTTPGATADLFHSHTTAKGAQDDWRVDTTAFPDWLSVSPSAGLATPGVNNPVTVLVNRTGHASGTYTYAFIVQSDGGSQTVTATMAVP